MVPDFIVAGNDCADIVKYNLNKLKEIYPESKVFLYDWGYKQKQLDIFVGQNDNLVVIPWAGANRTNYMYQKVVCIHHCFENHNTRPLVYIDSDIIITESIDEIFGDEWDIGATWRPEYSAEYHLLNAGILFINNANAMNSMSFLKAWESNCSLWGDKSWWVDQVELVKLFEQCLPSVLDGPNLAGILSIDGKKITCKTFSYNIYNFLPEMPKPYKDYYEEKPKVIHLKSAWRKTKFRLVNKDRWLQHVRTGDYGGLHSLNVLLNRLVGSYYFAKSHARRFLRAVKRKVSFHDYSEIGYWQGKSSNVDNLYDHEISRSRDYYKYFDQFLEIRRYNKVLDIGCGPIGGILDLLNADEKWAVEPIYSQYKEKSIWLPKSENLIIKETTCEDMEDVPDDYFDAVFTMNAIDHGSDIELCFKQVHKVLKSGGLFYLHVHCRKREELNKLHRQAFDDSMLLEMLANVGLKELKHRLYPSDPIPSNRYQTFMGVFEKQ